MQHPDPDIRQAIVKLCDALCSYERITGRESVLIVREQGGFEFRALSGKPSISSDIEDSNLLAMVQEVDS